MNDDFILIGATGAKRVFVYKYTGIAWGATPVEVFEPPAPASQYGYSIGLSATWAIVGTGQGGEKAFVYKNIHGTWLKDAVVVLQDTPTVASGFTADRTRYGMAVDVNENWAAVASMWHRKEGSDTRKAYGQVFIYKYGGTNWQTTASTVLDPGIMENSAQPTNGGCRRQHCNKNHFGVDLSMNSRWLVVGANLMNQARVYKNEGEHWNTTDVFRLLLPGGRDRHLYEKAGFGNAVAITDKWIVVGAHNEGTNDKGGRRAFFFANVCLNTDGLEANVQSFCSCGDNVCGDTKYRTVCDATQSACHPCKKGEYQMSDLKCSGCELGRYSNELGLTSASECAGMCPTGTYGAEIGMQSVDECTDCPEGKSNAGAGNVDCESCHPGRIVRAQNPLQCETCPAGKITTILTAHLDTNLTCEDCPTGRFIGADVVEFTGHDSVQDCKTCPRGYEINGTDTTRCIVCAWSHYQDQDGVSDVRCKTCPANSYITDHRDLDAAHNNVEDCIECGEGKFASPGERVCETCVAGKQRKEGTCVSCLAGQFSTNEEPDCQDCPQGFFQDQTGSPYCLPCLPGTFGNVSGATECIACPQGKISASAGNVSCQACDPGKSTDAAGSAKCTNCGAGRFSPGSGVPCRDCEVGKYVEYTGEPHCNSVWPGYSGGGRAPRQSQVKCAAGKYSHICSAAEFTGIQGALRGCEFGPLASTCVECPKGFFAENDGQDTCFQCQIGKFSDRPGSARCLSCGAGTYGKVRGEACVPCEPGRYRNGSDEVTDACHLCAPGFYQDSDGQASCLPW